MKPNPKTFLRNICKSASDTTTNSEKTKEKSSIFSMKTSVLLTNLGSPNSYLLEILIENG